MNLSPGARLGPFEIVSTLGVGGMGEVYRARDTRLNREVAIKVLPDVFAFDSDRLARFRREAQLLAALNHPNIATIHGLEESVTPPALVLELVEGPTLADRVASGPVPLVEALPIATQILNALETAHEQGIVHRDLKPSNIKVRPDGAVKVLDFGLAKATERPAGAGSATVSQSPTITSPVVTGTGVLLGTAAYMAPEQARGHQADRRSDMWAFGCVLYEMLTGKMAFGGPGVADTLAAVLKSDPDWAALPAGTPEPVLRLLRRCLAKRPGDRLADASAARLDLDDARDAPPRVAAPAVARIERMAWVTAFVLCVVGGGAWLWSRGSDARAQPEMRVDITSPPTTDLVSMALAPDGQTLAFVASEGGRSQLWLRSLVTGDARPLPDTDGASFPFWSPDSRSIGFFGSDRLIRIDADGGGLKLLATVPVAAGGTWSRNGVILFPLVPDAPLSQVRDTGGEVTAPPGPGPQEYRGGERFPQFLPDGRTYIYYMAQATVRGVYAGTLDGPERRRLFDADAAAVFLPPSSLLFVRAGTAYVQPFDTQSLSLTGAAVAVARGIALDSTGAPALSASSAGSIAYRVGSTNRQRQLMWVDRAGRQLGEALPPDPENALNPALSADGRQVVLSRTVDGNTDIWLIDLERPGAFTRITSSASPDITPRWAPGGRQIYYGGRGRIGFGIVARAPTAAAEDTIVFDGPAQDIPLDVSRDGRFLLFRSQSSNMSGSIDLWVLPLIGGGAPTVVAASGADETRGSISPDGQWVVFESNESGHYDVFVQPLHRPGERTLVSPGGGTQAQWAPDGTGVFYVARDGLMMEVSLRFGADGRTVTPSSPKALFPSRLSTTSLGGTANYAVSPDGMRFLLNAEVEHASVPITLVLNLTVPEP